MELGEIGALQLDQDILEILEKQGGVSFFWDEEGIGCRLSYGKITEIGIGKSTLGAIASAKAKYAARLLYGG